MTASGSEEIDGKNVAKQNYTGNSDSLESENKENSLNLNSYRRDFSYGVSFEYQMNI